MLQAVKFVSSSALGTGKLDGKFVPCSRVSCGVLISPCSSHGKYATLSHARVASKKYLPKDVSFICKAGLNGHRRNPFPIQQNGLGFSLSSNCKKEETGRLENLEELESSALEDGLMNSLSNPPRFKVTELPGPKEKEIVELFCKIQVQLQERSAAEEPTVESLQGKTSEKGSGTVNSLLKLLRKHSSDQSIKILNGNGRTGSIMDHSMQNGLPNGFRDLGFLKSSNHASFDSEKEKSNSSTSVRPEPYFRHKSPVAQTRRQHSPVYRRQHTMDFFPYIRNKNATHSTRPDSEQNPKLVANLPPDHELEHDPILPNVDEYHKEPNEEFLDSGRYQKMEEVSEGEETENS